MNTHDHVTWRGKNLWDGMLRVLYLYLWNMVVYVSMDTWNDTTMEWMAMHNCFNRTQPLSEFCFCLSNYINWPGMARAR